MKRNGKNICGKNVKAARIAKGMTQLELSKKLPASCKICRAGIAKIENGERLVADYELAQLSRVLSIPVSSLIK